MATLRLTARQARLLHFSVSERIRVMQEALQTTKNGNRAAMEKTMGDYDDLLDALEPLAESDDE